MSKVVNISFEKLTHSIKKINIVKKLNFFKQDLSLLTFEEIIKNFSSKISLNEQNETIDNYITS